MKMMRIPPVWTTNLVALLFGVGMYATFAFLPEFLQTPSAAGYGFGASITESGLLLLPQPSPPSSSAGHRAAGARIGAKLVLLTARWCPPRATWPWRSRTARTWRC